MAKKVIVVGRLENHLYILDTSSFSHDAIHIGCNLVSSAKMFVNKCTTSDVSMSTWHKRLGHIYENIMHHFPFCDNKSGVSFNCEICRFSKQGRMPFITSNSRTSESFDLLHIDIWGPYSVESIIGARYFLTSVDDYSRSTWFYLMKVKGQLFHTIKKFLNLVKTQYGTSFKMVRTDNRSKFLSVSCQTPFGDKGIAHQKSCPYTPHQNGIVERKHMSILQLGNSKVLLQNSGERLYFMLLT